MSDSYPLISTRGLYMSRPDSAQTTLPEAGWVRSGQTAYDTGTGFWLGNDLGTPKFSIGNSAGNKLTWNGTTLSITGSITATTGTIGGWTIGATTITGGSVTLDSTGNIRAGQTAYNTGTGFWLGVDSGTPKFSVGNSSGSNLTWNGTTLLLTSGLKFPASNIVDISANTSNGSDTGGISIAGGGTADQNRGAYLRLQGNEASISPGEARIVSGTDGDILITADNAISIQGVVGVSSSVGITFGGAAAGIVLNCSGGGGLYPLTSTVFPIGSTTAQWKDLFLAEGGVINWDSGDMTMTQAGNVLTIAGGDLAISEQISSLGGVSSAGTFGVPVVVAVGRSTAQTAAVGSISTFTVGASDGSFEISANVNVTTSTTHNFTVDCTYTDEGNTTRTLTLGFTQLSGATFITAITNVTGAGPYESPVYHIRCKAATAITFATVGVFTTVTYNVEGIIKQVN